MLFLDFIILIPIAWLAYKGFSKGLVMEFFSLAALLLGIYACIHFTDWTSDWLKKTFTESWAGMSLFVYLVTFVGAFAAVYFLGKAAEKLISISGLGIANKLGGAFFGAIKAALLVSGLLVVINTVNARQDFFKKEELEKSYLYTPIAKLSGYLLPIFHEVDWVKL